MKSGIPRVSLSLLATIGLASTLTGCGGSAEGGASAPTAGDFEEMTLSLHIAATPQHPQGIALQAFADEVSEATSGKVTIEPFFSNSLISGAEDLDGIGSGVAD